MQDKTQEEIEISAQEAPASHQELLDQIGSKLITARESRGEKLEQAVRTLKLQKSHLQALEDGRWEQLPDQVYALGFLRQYAKHLNLDISKELEQLSDAQYRLTKPLTFPDPPVAPSRKWAWLSGIAFVLLFVIFNIMNSGDDEHEIITAVTPESNVFSEPAAPASEPASSRLDESFAEEKPATVEPAPHKVVVDLSEEQVKPAKAKKKQAAAVHLYRFEAATGAVWMQVYAANESDTAKGKLLKEVLLQQGQYSTIRQAGESLWINCGNALSLRVKVDGKIVADTGTLGGGKKILRNFHFKLN
ncbi:hypothetical protein MMIC_P0781 [Mariprofundus micogutta]|uniref:Cytoskeleton protein RodZ n=1 Tax=Mariprofundus micogutta TaxID=1921010 RepID=A0A1L8CLN9_9PROT|nr:helix-turn-helix domain-containing protein [Mariprofundus micogutta]GAV19823.1 hypothetical protein MMIC_P0781 [Mariprofundus micogutta]